MRASQQQRVVFTGVWVVASALAISACGGGGDSVSIRGIEPGPICPAGGTEFIINDESHITCKDSETISVVQVARGEDGNPCVQGALKVTISEPGKTPIESWVCNELSADALPNGAKDLWNGLKSTLASIGTVSAFSGMCEAHIAGTAWVDPGYEAMADNALAVYEVCLLPYLALTEDLSGGALTAVQCMVDGSIAPMVCRNEALVGVDPQTDTCSADFTTNTTECLSNWDSGIDCASLSPTAEEEAAYDRFMALVGLVSTSCPRVTEIFN